MKKFFIVLFCIHSSFAYTDDIAFGKIKGVKVYDFSNNKVTQIYFDSAATPQTVQGCNGVAKITHSQRSTEALNQMVSIILTAYAAGKKVRAWSSANSCEVDFLAIQEAYF